MPTTSAVSNPVRIILCRGGTGASKFSTLLNSCGFSAEGTIRSIRADSNIPPKKASAQTDMPPRTPSISSSEIWAPCSISTNDT